MSADRAERTGDRDPAEFEKRRRKAARLLGKGTSQAETARLVGVSRQSVHRWVVALKRFGIESLRRVPRCGRKPRLNPVQQQDLILELKRGPLVQGFSVNGWTLALVKRLIQKRYGILYRRTELVGHLLRQAGFEPCGRGGWRPRTAKCVAHCRDVRRSERARLATRVESEIRVLDIARDRS